MAGRDRTVLKAVAMASMFVILLFPLTSEQAEGTTIDQPLMVEGDAGFLPTWFTGSGTPSDPYVLEGLRVDATNELHGIYIANTSKHFRIVDCTVHDAYSPQRDQLNISASGSGIILVNVSNAEVLGFLSDYNVRGVTVVNSRNVSISSSLFSNNIEAGVYLYGCTEGGCSVSNCTFERPETGRDGVLVEDCVGATVTNNTVEDGVTGIRLVSRAAACTDNLVEGNQLNGQTNGIVLEGEMLTSGNQVRGNQVQDADQAGIFVGGGTMEEIRDNTVSGCLYGVRLGWGGNAVKGNELANNTRGVSLDPGSDSNDISDNRIRDGEVGILISPSQGNLVHNNTISGMDLSNASVGIYLGVGAVTDTSVTSNSVSQCNVGIRAATTYAQTITNLSVLGNDVNASLREGLYLLYVSGSQVRNNSFLGGGGSGVMLYHCQGAVLEGNYMSGNLQYGLRMQESDGSLVTANVIHGNAQEGIFLASGSGNVVHGNALVFNKDSGRQYSALRAQAYCGEAGNNWSLVTGNLWADWTSPDQNEDGVVDLPYNISGGFQDPFPLTSIPGLIIPEDIVAPTVLDWTPQGTSVEVDSQVRITFSEDMDQGTVEATVNGLPVEGIWEDRSLILEVELEFETDHAVRVTGSDPAGNAMEPLQWTFRTEGPQATVSGRVLDGDGNAVTGAQVVCGDEAVLTDESGLFSLVLEPGERTLLVRMEGFQDTSLEVLVLPDQDMEVGDLVLVKEEAGSWYLIPAALAGAAVLGALLLLWYRRRR